MIASDWAEVLCSHREVQGQESCGGFETGSCSVLGFAGAYDLPAPMAIFTSVVKGWVYPEIY